MEDFTGFDEVKPFRVTGSYDFGNVKGDMHYSDAGYCFRLNGSVTTMTERMERDLRQVMDKASKAEARYEHLVNPGEIVPCRKKGTGIQEATGRHLSLKDHAALDIDACALFELIRRYDLLDHSEKVPIITIDLAGQPGTNTLLLALLRQKDAGGANKKDRYYTLEYAAYGLKKGRLPYRSEVKRWFHNNKSENWAQLRASEYNNGDLTDMNTIRDLQNLFNMSDKKKLQLIVAGAELKPQVAGASLYREQEHWILMYGEMLAALSIADSYDDTKGTHFVLKAFGFDTDPSQKILLMLSQCFETVEVCKPTTSRITSSERYIVCRNFRFKRGGKMITRLLAKFTEPFRAIQKKYRFCQDPFPEVRISEDDRRSLVNMNKTLQCNMTKACCMKRAYMSNTFQDQNMRRQLLDLQRETTRRWISEFIDP